MAMVIRAMKVPESVAKLPVYHFAPEPSLMPLIRQRFNDGYRPADFSPESFTWSPVVVSKVDLSSPATYFPPRSIGGFIHSHVLEHLPVPVEGPIKALNDALVPGGFHLFQVPVEVGESDEDLDPAMAPEERLRRFKQEDHMRIFGTNDFEERVLSLFRHMKQVSLSSLVSQRSLRRAGLPADVLDNHNGHIAYLFIKRSPMVEAVRRFFRLDEPKRQTAH